MGEIKVTRSVNEKTASLSTASIDVSGMIPTGQTITGNAQLSSETATPYTLATFVDTDPAASSYTASNYSAIIDWGDQKGDPAATFDGAIPQQFQHFRPSSFEQAPEFHHCAISVLPAAQAVIFGIENLLFVLTRPFFRVLRPDGLARTTRN